LGQPVRQASALACEGSVCHPLKERKKKPEFVADVVLQSLWAFVSNDRLKMGVLQCVPDVCVIVLLQRVQITAQRAGKQKRVLCQRKTATGSFNFEKKNVQPFNCHIKTTEQRTIAIRVIGTLAVGWAVTFGTARRRLGGAAQPAQVPPRCTKCNSSPISGQCTNFVLFGVAVLPLESKGLNTRN